MTAHQISILLLISLFLFILPAFGLYFMFKKAGAPAWKGLVPVLNSFEMLRLRKDHCSGFLQFIPVVAVYYSRSWSIRKTFGKFGSPA
jgi:hypothetical protein